MWLNFENQEFRSDLESRKGDKYSAYVVSGTKRGWKDAPDEPWSKTVFENTFTKVIDRTGNTAEMVINEFFDACQEGDLIDLKQEKQGDFWQIVSLENKTRSVLPEGASAGFTSFPATASDGWDAAVTFVGLLVNNGHYKEKTNPEVLLDEVVTYRARLDALTSMALDAPVGEYED